MIDPLRLRRRLPLFIAAHAAASAGVAAWFAWRFDQNPYAVGAHFFVVAQWDVAVAACAVALAACRADANARWPFRVYRLLVGATVTLQAYLYALNVASHVSWGRIITGRLVATFAPTVWSGREPFPIGAPGISVFAVGTLAVAFAATSWRARWIDQSLQAWLPEPRRHAGTVGMPRRAALLTGCLALAALSPATLTWGVAARDTLFWRQELVVTFFRPEGFAFEPTARRQAVAERDAALRASYPRARAGTHRTHVVLVIVDSLRADRMQVYGYQRETTPFLAGLVRDGRMKKVEAAFSTCSESFCGITSTLAGREFRDISARTFQLQDVLRDEGYQTWFLLSGNHTAWNGLPAFYHAVEGTLFDGAQTERYTMDDDRLVLEGLERVPPAAPGRPAFFYVHLMSPHYLGVQFPESHVFTRPNDRVSPGLEPYKILQQLNKPDRYDDKVRQTDDVIRQLFDALRAKGYLDDAIVVVTGDHGEGLGERHWAHGWHLYNEDIRIPLLLYDEPATSYPDLAFGAQVDIGPTILGRLGLPIPESWDGQSLLAPERRRFTFHQTYFTPNRFAVLYRDDEALFKFIATPQYGTEELYDLRRDQREARNLIAEQPALAELLREKVREYRGE